MKANPKTRLAAMLIAARTAKGLTQAELSDHGFPIQTLRCWEQGTRVPTLDLAYRLGRVLGVSVDAMAEAAAADADSDAKQERAAG